MNWKIPLARPDITNLERKAVLERYNWEKESKKLLKIYEELLSK